MRDPDDRLYLGHMRDAIRRILEYTSGGKNSFDGDARTQDAVVRNLEIIGEAAKRVSDQTRTAHPEIPWRDMAGTRDKVIHDYVGVSLDIVWDIVANDLPPLERQLDAVLQRLAKA